jgi:hypothetical protein
MDNISSVLVNTTVTNDAFKLFLPSLLTLCPVSQVCDLENVLVDDQARLQDALVLIAYYVINSAAS